MIDKIKAWILGFFAAGAFIVLFRDINKDVFVNFFSERLLPQEISAGLGIAILTFCISAFVMMLWENKSNTGA